MGAADTGHGEILPGRVLLQLHGLVVEHEYPPGDVGKCLAFWGELYLGLPLSSVE